MNQEQEIWTIDHYIRDMCDHILNFAFNNGHIPQILFQKGPVDSNTQPKFINNSIIITCPQNMDDNTLHSMLMQRLTTLGSELAIGDSDTCTVKLIQFESQHRHKAGELEQQLSRKNSKKNNGIFYKVIKWGDNYCVMECNVKDLKLKQALQNQYRHQQSNKNNREDNTSIEKKKRKLIASIQEFLITGKIGETPTIYKDEEEDKELLTLYYAHQILNKIQSPNKGYIRQTYLKTISDNYPKTDPKDAIKIISQCLVLAAYYKMPGNQIYDTPIPININPLVSSLKINLNGHPCLTTINLESETTEMDMDNCLKKLEEAGTITYNPPITAVAQPTFQTYNNYNANYYYNADQLQQNLGTNNNIYGKNNINNINDINTGQNNNFNKNSSFPMPSNYINNDNYDNNNQNFNINTNLQAKGANLENFPQQANFNTNYQQQANIYNPNLNNLGKSIDKVTYLTNISYTIYDAYIEKKYNSSQQDLNYLLYFDKENTELIKQGSYNQNYVQVNTTPGTTIYLPPETINEIYGFMKNKPATDYIVHIHCKLNKTAPNKITSTNNVFYKEIKNPYNTAFKDVNNGNISAYNTNNVNINKNKNNNQNNNQTLDDHINQIKELPQLPNQQPIFAVGNNNHYFKYVKIHLGPQEKNLLKQIVARGSDYVFITTKKGYTFTLSRYEIQYILMQCENDKQQNHLVTFDQTIINSERAHNNLLIKPCLNENQTVIKDINYIVKDSLSPNNNIMSNLNYKS